MTIRYLAELGVLLLMFIAGLGSEPEGAGESWQGECPVQMGLCVTLMDAQ